MPDLSFDEATHEYRRDGLVLPHVTGILSAEGLYKGSDWWTPEGRTFGGYVHQAVEYFNRGTLDWDTLDDALIGCVRSYEAFCQATHFEPILIEQTLFCDLGYAGKPDVSGLFQEKNQNAVIDAKTGTPQPADQIQTAFYQMLLEHNGHRVHVRGSLYLERNGKLPKWKAHTERSDFVIAMSILNSYNFKRRNGLL